MTYRHAQGPFGIFPLSPALLLAVAEAGYEVPCQMQQACIPPILAGRDLTAQGYSGSGKHLAFVLPLLEGLDLSDPLPQVLVLTPTGELAIQIAELFQNLARHLSGFHVLPIHGGEGQMVQLRQLDRGVNVVVGTPRWTLGHIENGRLLLDHLRTLVLDCADDLLRMDFQEDIAAIFAHAPAQRQTVVFAADRLRGLDRLIQERLHDPVAVVLPDEPVEAPALRQRYWPVDSAHKLEALIRLIEVEARFNAALVYVHTQIAAANLAEKLAARGYGVAAIDGDTPRRTLDRVANQLAEKRIDLVVATDPALPGLELSRVTHVIHYDLPCDTAAYHTRLAHAPTAHSSLLLVGPTEMRMLHGIEHGIGQSIDPLVLPQRSRGH
jgi:ATP-dependent RNA helicase DeaD